MSELQLQLNELRREFDELKASSTIPREIEQAFRDRFRLGTFDSLLTLDLQSAPLTAITAPTGGATTDSQARTAINNIITALETLGLILPN